MGLKHSTTAKRDGVSVPIPTDLLSRIFSQVACRRIGPEIEVVFQLLLPPFEEWNTVIALDASESMRSLWGKSLIGDVPLAIQERYHRQNWIIEEKREGQLQRFFQPEAFEDAIASGYLRWVENEIEPIAQNFLEFMARKVDVRESCDLMYWGCERGLGWMDLGQIKREDCGELALPFPEIFSFGNESKLLPLVQFLVGRSANVPKTLVVILTDGNFSDFDEVQSYSTILATLIKARQINFMRFVVVGVGKGVNQENLARLAGMKTGLELELWDCRMADEVKDPVEIFTGFVPENQVVAPAALIFDAKGNLVKEFKAGLPGKGTFRMPVESNSFSLQIPPNPQKFVQPLNLPFHQGIPGS